MPRAPAESGPILSELNWLVVYVSACWRSKQPSTLCGCVCVVINFQPEKVCTGLQCASTSAAVNCRNSTGFSRAIPAAALFLCVSGCRFYMLIHLALHWVTETFIFSGDKKKPAKSGKCRTSRDFYSKKQSKTYYLKCKVEDGWLQCAGGKWKWALSLRRLLMSLQDRGVWLCQFSSQNCVWEWSSVGSQWGLDPRLLSPKAWSLVLEPKDEVL